MLASGRFWGALTMVFRRRAWAFFVYIDLLLAAPLLGATIGGAGGLVVSVDPGGTYSIAGPDTGWRFEGNAGAPLSNVATVLGTDSVGGYAEISFDFQIDAARHAAIRSYD